MNRISILILVMLGMALCSTAGDETQIKPIKWPTDGGLPLRYSLSTVQFDGSAFEIGTVTMEGAAWETTFPQVWARRPGSARFPLIFAPRSNLPVTMGVACFGPKQFLAGIEDSEWDRYLLGLRSERGESFEILEQTSATAPGSNWIPVLGAKTRMVSFRHLVAPDRYEAEIQVFVFDEGRLAVFVLSGPEKSVQANAALFYSSLRGINSKPSRP